MVQRNVVLGEFFFVRADIFLMTETWSGEERLGKLKWNSLAMPKRKFCLDYFEKTQKQGSEF